MAIQNSKLIRKKPPVAHANRKGKSPTILTDTKVETLLSTPNEWYVIAEFQIVILRFVFSYEQTLMSDLVRFWYGSLFLFGSYYTLIKDGHVRVDVLYTNFTEKNKAKINLFGSLILGIPLCLTIFLKGMACKQCVLNQPIMNFETSQSTQGMNIKYLMAGFLIIFALTMLIQFVVYFLRSLNIIKEE